MSVKEVAGKTAFITGGASGLGLAMARSFTGAGMKVAIADVQEDALAAVKEEFAESNADVITIRADVTDPMDWVEKTPRISTSIASTPTKTECRCWKVSMPCSNLH